MLLENETSNELLGRAPDSIDIKLNQLSIAQTLFLNLFESSLCDWERASKEANTEDKFRNRLMATRFNLLDVVNDMTKDLLKEVGVKPDSK